MEKEVSYFKDIQLEGHINKYVCLSRFCNVIFEKMSTDSESIEDVKYYTSNNYGEINRPLINNDFSNKRTKNIHNYLFFNDRKARGSDCVYRSCNIKSVKGFFCLSGIYYIPHFVSTTTDINIEKKKMA